MREKIRSVLAAVLAGTMLLGQATTIRAEEDTGREDAVCIATYMGQIPAVDGVAWSEDVTADMFNTPYETVTISSTDGKRYNVEVIPDDLVYFISGGTGTGYYNNNKTAAVSEPFQAVAELEKGLKNDMADAVYTEERGWGHLYDGEKFKVSSTVDNGDRPEVYTSTDKYTVGLRDKTNGAVPMTYRFTLEPGKYELTTGYHEFYGANRSRDMQPRVVWTDFTGLQQTAEGEEIHLRSENQTGAISFEIDSRCTVDFELAKTGGEAPMFSWISVRKTGDVEIEAGYNTTYLVQVLQSQEDHMKEQEEAGYIYTEKTLAAYEAAKAEAEKLIGEESQDADAIKIVLENLVKAFSELKTTMQYSSFSGAKGTGKQEWLDNNGEHIQAHGGQVQWLDTLDLDEDGVKEGGWIWVGEDKTRNGKPIDGIRCYTSSDLYNWTDRGIVLRTHDMIPAKLTADGKGIEEDLEALETMKRWAEMSEPSEDVAQEDIDMAREFTEAYRNADGSYDEENLQLAFSNLFSGYCIAERPKMIYNANTEKYIIVYHADGPSDEKIAAWLKDSSSSPSRYTRASMGFAVSDTPYGPYKLVNVQRMNYVDGYYDESKGMARDMNVFVDDTDIDKNGVKDAYAIYSSEENRKMYISLLNADYTGPATEGNQDSMTLSDGTEIQTFAARVLPADSREAPALFKYDGYYYMITSGTSGWTPNQALYYRAENIYGPYEAMGDPCIGDTDRKTFYSQSTCVFPVDAENGRFIYIGDRWLTSETTGSAAWWSGYVWLPVQINSDHTIALNKEEDWSMDTMAFVSPVETTMVEGKQPELPKTVTLEFFSGRTEERDVTWNIEETSFEDSLLRQVAVSGTVEGGFEATAQVMVIPDTPEYLIDCGNPESEEFELVRSIAGENLLQDQADQKKTAQNSWGYTSEENTDIVGKTNAGSGCYDTGWYALAGKDISYQMLLPSGTHEITLGFRDWWGQYEERPMAVYVKTEDGEETKLCDVPSPGQNLIQVSGSVELDKESMVTVTVRRTGSADPVLSWIASVKQGQPEEPETVDRTSLEGLIEYAKAQQKMEEYQYVTPAVKETFEKALAQAEAVYAEEEADQAAVDEAYAELLEKVHLLGYTGNASKLQIAYDVFSGKDLSIYTEESRKVMEEALARAAEVLENENALQEEIDGALQALNDANSQLELIAADKTSLGKLIEEAEGLDLSLYTEETAAAVREALAEAKTVFADVNAGSGAVEKAEEELQNALSRLEKKEIPDDSGQTENPDGGKDGVDSETGTSAVKTGDYAAGVITTVGSLLLSLAGMGTVLVMKKRRKQ